MDLTASSIALFMNVLVFMFVQKGLSQKTDRSEHFFPRIVLSKQQFFMYNNLTVTCEGFFNDMTKWRVLRNNVFGKKNPCNKNSTKFGTCHIAVLYPSDSGEYWCESEDRRRSKSVQITVTSADNATLESPVHPVMVGDNVTLRCLESNNQNSTKFEFYKDGVSVHTSSTGAMTLHNISESDQGRYKCKISENKFSEENLLQVNAVFLECPDQPVMEGENMTLFCRDKTAAANYMSFFYKDDKMIGKSSTGKLTLNKVSKSDDGVFKCKTSENRESEEQWLSVRGAGSVHDVSGITLSTPLSLTALTALVALPLLLLVLGFIYKKYKAEVSEPATVIYSLINDVGTNRHHDLNATEGAMYCTVNKAKRCGPSNDVQGELYSTVDKKKKNQRPSSETAIVYSAVKKNKGRKPGNSSGGMAAEEALYSLVR